MKTRLVSTAAAIVLLFSALTSAERVRFAVLGDTQGRDNGVSTAALSSIVEKTLALDPPIQFVVVVGDLVTGTYNDQAMMNQFRHWRQTAQPWYEANLFGNRVYVLPGNHDLTNQWTCCQLWQAAFPELPDNGPGYDKQMTYSFDVGPCHIVCVNTSAPGLRDHTVDLDWLEADLSGSDKPIKFVFGHEPAYKVEPNHIVSLDRYPAQRDRFWQILADHGVKAYFCGHDHLYDRWIKDGVHQIIVGGSGPYHYLIVDADEQDVTMSVYREEGNLLLESYAFSGDPKASDEDRTINDNPNWPINGIPCLPTSMLVMIVLYFAGLLIYNAKP